MAQRNMSNEQAGRIVAGISVIFVFLLAEAHHPWWYFALLGIGANLVVSGVTNRCPVRTLLIHLGFAPERTLGRAEEQHLRPERS